MREQKGTFIFFVFLFSFSSFQFKASAEVCDRLFKKNYHQSIFFDISSGLSNELPLFAKALEDIKPRKRVIKKQREQAEADFLLAFKQRNPMAMAALIKEFPFLKDIRFKDPSVLEQIHKKHHHWCPRGWSPSQIASYTRDIELLDFVLAMEMNILSIKISGGESIESNPLHISIKRNFKEGVVRILESTKKVPYGRRGRFIDEKDHLKQTPWYLAIQRDILNGIKRDVENQISNRKIYYMDILGKYEPSALTSSYTLRGDMDSLEAAYDTGIPIVIKKAHRYVVAPNYDHYKDIRANSRYEGLKRPW